MFFHATSKSILPPKCRTRQNHKFLMAIMLLCLTVVATSFTMPATKFIHSRMILPHPASSCTWLRQSTATTTTTMTTTTPSSSTTTLRQETVPLNWMEFHTPSGASSSNKHTPVLLLHGLLGSKRNFATLAASLGAQLDIPRRIIGVDLRNHGDSDWASEMSYLAMAQDVCEFLDSQQIDKIILVGHSMGGKVAQAMSLLYPERVDGLVVLDIAPVQYSRSDPHWKAVEDILHAIHAVCDDEAVSAGKAALDKQLKGSIPDPNLRAFVLTNYDNRKKTWKIPIVTIVEQLEAIAGFDVPEKVQYDGDVFIIHGGQSRFVRHAYIDKIASYFPNHMLTTIRGAGHWVHAEAPDDTIALLKQYLDR